MISVRKEMQISFSCKLIFSQLALWQINFQPISTMTEKNNDSDWDPLKFSTHTMTAEVGREIIAPTVYVSLASEGN